MEEVKGGVIGCCCCLCVHCNCPLIVSPLCEICCVCRCPLSLSLLLSSSLSSTHSTIIRRAFPYRSFSLRLAHFFLSFFLSFFLRLSSFDLSNHRAVKVCPPFAGAVLCCQWQTWQWHSTSLPTSFTANLHLLSITSGGGLWSVCLPVCLSVCLPVCFVCSLTYYSLA